MNTNNSPSVFYGQGSPQQQQGANPYTVGQQQALGQQVGVVDMKNDMQNLMNNIGQEAQIKMQQQLAQLVINKVYQTEEQKKKQAEEAGAADESENCSSMLFKKCCFFLDVEFYAPYFREVTTSAVIKRIGYSLMPFKADFFSVADTKPDMYGPLWISFAMVFSLTAAGNLSAFLQSHDSSKFSYKFSMVQTAFSLVFAYSLIVPILISFLMKLFGSKLTFYLQTICIYGYSLFVFIPVTFLCTIPMPTLQYCLFIYAALNSTFFLLNNYLSKLNELKTSEGQTDRKKIIIGMIAGIQILMMFLFKFYFFKSLNFSFWKSTIEDDIPFSSDYQNNFEFNNTTSSHYDSSNITLSKQLHYHHHAHSHHQHHGE